MKKKILVWETSEKISGGQRMTLNIAKMLGDDFDFVFIIPSMGSLSDELNHLNIKYYLACSISLPFGKKRIGNIFHYLKVSSNWIKLSKKIIKQEKPDLLYCPGPAALPWSAKCGKCFRLPVVWHLHHTFIDKKTRLLLNHYAKYDYVKRIICVSDVVGEQINSKIANAKKTTLYNPVDFEKFNHGSNAFADEFKNIIGNLALDELLVFAHIGNIQKQKRQDFSIKLLNEFSSQIDKKCVCLFVGKVTDTDFYNKFNTMILKNDNVVKFLYIGERQDIPNILQVVDFLLLPSYEGFPLAGLEAMCCGIPLLGATGGAAELITKSKSGETFDYDDISSGKKALMNLVFKRETYSENAILFSKKMDFMSYKISLLKLLEELL